MCPSLFVCSVLLVTLSFVTARYRIKLHSQSSDSLVTAETSQTLYSIHLILHYCINFLCRRPILCCCL
jgi:hypothetical protein